MLIRINTRAHPPISMHIATDHDRRARQADAQIKLYEIKSIAIAIARSKIRRLELAIGIRRGIFKRNNCNFLCMGASDVPRQMYEWLNSVPTLFLFLVSAALLLSPIESTCAWA